MLNFILTISYLSFLWPVNSIQVFNLCGGNIVAFPWNKQPSQHQPIGENVCVSKTVEVINLNDDESGGRPRANNVPDVRGDMAKRQNGDDRLISLNNQRNALAVTCKTSQNHCACEYRNTTGNVVNVTNVVYECCHGYAQEFGQPGCPKKLELKSLLQTLKERNFGKFYEAIEEVGLSGELNKGNYTIFAPTDETFIKETTSIPDIVNNDLPGDGRQPDNSELRLKALKKLLLSHIVPGIVKTSNFKCNVPLATLATDPTPLKIKMDLTDGVWTANCVPLMGERDDETGREIQAENGVIHPVGGFLPPAQDSVYDILQKQPQFSRMLELLESAGLVDELKSSKGGSSHTILALTNDVFDKMDPTLLDKLKTGDQCALRIIKHHVIPKTVCSKYIGKGEKENLLGGDFWSMLLNINDKSSLSYAHYTMGDNASLLQTDIPALNGLVHVVDKLVVPPEAKSIMERLEDEKETTKFIQLLTQNSDVIKDLKEGSTIYVPKDSAFKELDESTQKKLESGKEYQIQFLRNHIFSGEDLRRQDRMTFYKSVTPLSGNSLTASYGGCEKNPYALQCSRIASDEEEACEAKYVLINKIIKPNVRSSDADWMLGLKEYAEISRFVELLTHNDYKLDSPNRTYTIYAPSNDILTQEKLEALKNSPKEKSSASLLTTWGRDDNAQDFMERHIKEGYECCSANRKRITLISSWNPLSVLDGMFSSSLFDFPTFGMSSVYRGHDLKRRGAVRNEYQCQDIPLTPKLLLHILNSNDA